MREVRAGVRPGGNGARHRLQVGPRPAVLCMLLGLTCIVAFTAASAVRPAVAGPQPGGSAPQGTVRPTSQAVAAPTRPTVLARPVAASPRRTELPRGGTTVFPRYRLVGFSGGPGTAAFGRLGVGNIDQRVAEIERLGRRYAAGRQVMPVLELIAVVAQRKPGEDGLYRVRVDAGVIRSYLDAARRHRALLLLNIQPGRADFITEVKALEPWLSQPDVGLALDPEWAVGPGQVPGRSFGSTTGAEVDAVAGYLQRLVVGEPAAGEGAGRAPTRGPDLAQPRRGEAASGRGRDQERGRDRRRGPIRPRPGTGWSPACRRPCTPGSSCSSPRTAAPAG